MGLADYLVKNYTRRLLIMMSAKAAIRGKITETDLNNLIRALGKFARLVMRKKGYGPLRAFCGGLAQALSKAEELSKIFDDKTMVPIRNIMRINQDILNKTEEEVKGAYGGLGDIKINIRDSLNQLAASIRKTEIPKTIAAKVVA